MAGARCLAGGLTEVVPVGSGAERRRFIRYPFVRYMDDPNWVPPLLLAEKEQFDRKNPFFEHARIELFLARRAAEIVGRVAAIDDDNHNKTHGDNLAFFGFFEAKDQDAALALLARVEDWARALGRRYSRTGASFGKPGGTAVPSRRSARGVPLLARARLWPAALGDPRSRPGDIPGTHPAVSHVETGRAG